MSSITPIGQLLQVLRAQAVAARPHGATARPDGRVRDTPAEVQAQVAPFVAARIRALGRDDPRRRERALRAFLEGLLLRSFGGEAAADAGFDDVLQRVEASLHAEPHTAAATERLVDLLLADVDRGGDLSALMGASS